MSFTSPSPCGANLIRLDNAVSLTMWERHIDHAFRELDKQKIIDAIKIGDASNYVVIFGLVCSQAWIEKP